MHAPCSMPALGSCAIRRCCGPAAADAVRHRRGPAADLANPCAARWAVSTWQPTADRVACAVLCAQPAWADVPEWAVSSCFIAIAVSCSVSSTAGFTGVLAVDFCTLCSCCILLDSVADYLATCPTAPISCAASSYAHQKWGGSSQKANRCSLVTAADRLVSALSSEFAVKDLGRLHYFLGLEVSYSASGLTLTQQKYSMDLLRRSGMLECKSATTPMSSTDRLSALDGALLSADDATEYRSIVGASYGLHLQPARSRVLSAFSDADWAGSPEDRRSTGGHAVFFGPNLIAWSARNKRQCPAVALKLNTKQLQMLQLRSFGYSLCSES
ncbi:hypothetical protein QYE76_054178 [Lolium multiflorum]|uniref:Reverse transcriptase Ty1/copia-type domain-containing protein n=1 Tax=Lolium multiflorum TaxID=4521 RepID=A0AAD8SXS6_LOLMU|nr:hypothetical protein QYE76_054178 [Lolium multiflorum]